MITLPDSLFPILFHSIPFYLIFGELLMERDWEIQLFLSFIAKNWTSIFEASSVSRLFYSEKSYRLTRTFVLFPVLHLNLWYVGESAGGGNLKTLPTSRCRLDKLVGVTRRWCYHQTHRCRNFQYKLSNFQGIKT